MRRLRPPISAPEHVVAAGQPRLGLLGLWLVLPVAVLLAVAAGGPEDSFRVVGPIVLFSLTPIVMIAFWWEDWPGTRLGPNWAGWADTVLIAVAAVVLTGVAQAIAGGLDLRGIFEAHPGPGHVPTFPATLAIGGAAFAVMLQLTLVGEGWPLRSLPATVGGPLALAGSWAIALILYFALVKVHPAAGSAVTPRPGPVASADFGAALVWLGAWQVLFFVVWRGWPTSRLTSRAVRLPAANALVIGAALVTLPLVRLVLEPATARWGDATSTSVAPTLVRCSRIAERPGASTVRNWKRTICECRREQMSRATACAEISRMRRCVAALRSDIASSSPAACRRSMSSTSASSSRASSSVRLSAA